MNQIGALSKRRARAPTGEEEMSELTDEELDQLTDVAQNGIGGLDASNAMSVIHEVRALRARVKVLEESLRWYAPHSRALAQSAKSGEKS